MTYNFFATISRMKYIERWALMRNSRPENLSEHSAEVAMIAHALCTIGNVRYGRNLDAEKAALIGIFHDASEIITGDLPTPVKYYNDELKTAYKQVEAIAEDRLLDKLPADLRPVYEGIFHAEVSEEEAYMRRLLKAADKISALIKCIEEENAGNREFRSAKITIQKSIEEMCNEYPEVDDFMKEFVPPYGSTLDELQADSSDFVEEDEYQSLQKDSTDDTLFSESDLLDLGDMFRAMVSGMAAMGDEEEEESPATDVADQSFYSDLYGRFADEALE